MNVKCESYGNSLLYYPSAPQQHFQLPSGYSGLQNQQFYNAPLALGSNRFNAGQYSQQQFGTGFQYQQPVDYTRSFQPFQFQQPQYQQQFNSFGAKPNAFGGRSAHRSHRLQHLYTKAIPSSSSNQQASVASTRLKPVAPTLTLPTPSFLRQSSKLLTPATDNYFAPTPQPIQAIQVSGTIASAPAFPSIPAAPPLPPIPSVSQFATKSPKQLFSGSADFSMTSSIPFAEGHSIGNNIAYTYNSGFGAAQPQTFLSSAGDFATLGASSSQLLTNQGIQGYNYQTPAAPATASFDASPYSLGGLEYSNLGANSGDLYGNDFSNLFSNVFKRESKPSDSRRQVPTKTIKKTASS